MKTILTTAIVIMSIKIILNTVRFNRKADVFLFCDWDFTLDCWRWEAFKNDVS